MPTTWNQRGSCFSMDTEEITFNGLMQRIHHHIKYLSDFNDTTYIVSLIGNL